MKKIIVIADSFILMALIVAAFVSGNIFGFGDEEFWIMLIPYIFGLVFVSIFLLKPQWQYDYKNAIMTFISGITITIFICLGFLLFSNVDMGFLVVAGLGIIGVPISAVASITGLIFDIKRKKLVISKENL